MSRGAYHFFRASKTLSRRPISSPQSSRVRASTQPPILRMLDVEVTDGASPSDVVSSIRAFLDEAQKKLGATLIIYTGPSFWISTLGNPDFSSNPLWIAHYTKAAKPKVPSHWSNYTIWQFSETLPVAGVASPGVDNDRGQGATEPVRPDASVDANTSKSCVPDGGDGGDSGLIPGTCTHDVCVAGERAVFTSWEGLKRHD